MKNKMIKLLRICTPISIYFAVSFAFATGDFQIHKNDFASLYNQYRIAQPAKTPWAGSFYPYAQHGTAVQVNRGGKSDPKTERKGTSAMEAYDSWLGSLNSEERGAYDWEKANHTCETLSPEEKEGCEGWWGHCNAWAAAACVEDEPRVDKKVAGKTLSVADQKGILTEMWMGANSLFAGETNKMVRTGAWVLDSSKLTDDYESFWDVSPRSFFLIFTNYVGIAKKGIVIDRFTGDQVWNQPIVGYRILPIRTTDIINENRDGVKYNKVLIRVKIYWANDLGTPPGHVTTPLNIAKNTNDNEVIEDLPGDRDYEGRLLKMWFAFSDFSLSPDGKTILKTGEWIGDGVWDHQANPDNYLVFDETHPDFIWMPTNAYRDFSGYGNPYVDPERVYDLLKNAKAVRSAKSKTLKFEFMRDVFASDIEPNSIKLRIQKILRREGISSRIYLRDIVVGADRISVRMFVSGNQTKSEILELFKVAGL